MKDQFGRKIDYLRLSVTDRCNLRCRYCMPETGIPVLAHDSILRYEELLRIAETACRMGIRKIRVTGGEPLVRKGLVPFVSALTQLPQKPDVVLTTNGLLLTDYAAALKSAGLTRVNVSLDTLRPDRFEKMTLRDGLEQVLKGISLAEAVGLHPIKINMIPLKNFNQDEITHFARLTFDHPWDVRFIEFMPISDDLDFVSSDGVRIGDVHARLLEMGPLELLPHQRTSGPAKMYRFPGAQGRIGLISSVTGHCCEDCNRLRVMADGRIRGCLLNNQEIDLKPVLRGAGSAQDLENLLSAAIDLKPEKHQIDQKAFTTPNRRMHGIGG